MAQLRARLNSRKPSDRAHTCVMLDGVEANDLADNDDKHAEGDAAGHNDDGDEPLRKAATLDCDLQTLEDLTCPVMASKRLLSHQAQTQESVVSLLALCPLACPRRHFNDQFGSFLVPDQKGSFSSAGEVLFAQRTTMDGSGTSLG